MEPLTGSALLEKIRELKLGDYRETAKACGYTSDSRALTRRFLAALIEANGGGKPSGTPRGRFPSASIRVQGTGMVSVASTWVEKLGLQAGDRLTITVKRGRIILTPEKPEESDSSETEQSEATTEACTISATPEPEAPSSTTTYIESTGVAPTTWTAPTEVETTTPTATVIA